MSIGVLKKSNVYVVVDTKKKARRVKYVLEMFGEDYCDNTFNKEFGVLFYDNDSLKWRIGFMPDNPVKVSVKQLRNMLAVESNSASSFSIGKWYKGTWDDDVFGSGHILALFNGIDVRTYGVHHEHGFLDGVLWFSTKEIENLNYLEAAPEEVEKALIAEAKRRGYKVGDKIKSFIHGNTPIEHSSIKHRFSSNILVMGGAFIFKEGKWAEIIEVDKFADLKKAHAEGAVIQMKDIDSDIWDDLAIPAWHENRLYRIKPEEKPKVGDVVAVVIFGEPSEFVTRIESVLFRDSEVYNVNGWDVGSCRIITPHQVIELLFGKESFDE